MTRKQSLQRTLTYSISAVMLGLALVLVPMIALAEIRQTPSTGAFPSSSRSFVEMEGVPADVPKVSALEVEFLIGCFVIALVAYVFIKSRMPEREHSWLGPFLY